MMKRIGCIILLLYTVLQSAYSQRIGEWETLLSYYNTILVAESNEYVFGVARAAQPQPGVTDEGGALFSYGKEDNSIRFYSKQDGLHDSQITLIGYNQNVNTLLIVYKNGNIDLLGDYGFYNLSYLLNNTSITNKTINDIFFYKEFAYLPTQFGIMVLNLKKKEISETYKLNQPVTSVCIQNNQLYAATASGIMRGAMDSNLLDVNNWQPHSIGSVDAGSIHQLALFQNQFCFFIKGKGVYYQQTAETIKPLIEDNTIQKIKLQNDKLIAFTSNKAYLFSSLTARDVVNTGTINDISSLKDKNTYWIAAGLESIKGIRKKEASDQYEIIFSDTITAKSGPKRNLCAFMTVHDQKLLVTGGDRWSVRNNNYGTLMTYENGSWFSFDENKIAEQAKSQFRDITSVAVDPTDNTHYFASTWGEGLFEFKDNQFVKLYNQDNSPLLSTNGDPNYIRTEGVCFDQQKNLWITNSGINTGGIKVLKPDGTWVSLAPDLEDYLIDKILITSKKQKWVNVLRSNTGIFILDDQGTLDDTSDDISRLYRTFRNTADQKEIPANSYFCMAEDKTGSIWIGTNNGIIITSSSAKVPQSETIYASRIIRTDENGNLTYFLDGERINAIAVDGGNRKWIGTEGSGVFLVNEDGSETIHNFTAANSPLLSDKIKSIAIDQISGKVYFGTENGMISYMAEAIAGKESYSDVYAFPNPVRPEYIDQVTITGLMENSNVKITDLNGNIIFQGRSAGGQLSWNCRNRSGNRVATGVYLVFAATPDSKESVVTKIMVVK